MDLLNSPLQTQIPLISYENVPFDEIMLTTSALLPNLNVVSFKIFQKENTNISIDLAEEIGLQQIQDLGGIFEEKIQRPFQFCMNCALEQISQLAKENHESVMKQTAITYTQKVIRIIKQMDKKFKILYQAFDDIKQNVLNTQKLLKESYKKLEAESQKIVTLQNHSPLKSAALLERYGKNMKRFEEFVNLYNKDRLNLTKFIDASKSTKELLFVFLDGNLLTEEENESLKEMRKLLDELNKILGDDHKPHVHIKDRSFTLPVKSFEEFETQTLPLLKELQQQQNERWQENVSRVVQIFGNAMSNDDKEVEDVIMIDNVPIAFDSLTDPEVNKNIDSKVEDVLNRMISEKQSQAEKQKLSEYDTNSLPPTKRR